MNKVAFYVMNLKGYFVVKNFIEKFGVNSISYIVSSRDETMKEDCFEAIETLAIKSKIKFLNRFENITELESLKNVYKFAIGWRWIIKNENNLIVFHDSLLPKYRGFAPLINSLINKESQGGVTALFANSDYDKGNIIAQEGFKLNYPAKIDTVIEQIQPVYFNLVVKIFKDISENVPLYASKQNEENATYSPWLNNEDYYIDWSWNSEKIKRFIDAVGYPYDGAKAYLNRKTINFVDVKVIKDVAVESRSRHIGKVIFIKDGLPVVVCKEGLIQLVDIRDDESSPVFVNFRSKFN